MVITEQALARTYSHPSVADPYDIVQQYHTAMKYGPDASSTAVARDLEVPRGRVRPWLDGAKPDSVHAIETADKMGWLADEWTPTVRAFAELVAGVFACGSIERAGWVPGWSPDSAIGRETIEDALTRVGVGARYVAREAARQGDEIRPRQHRSVLGRALHPAGAPVGDKNKESVTRLPKWLSTAPPAVRAAFAELLVRERGSKRSGKATLQIQAARPRPYFEDVRKLVEDVTGESVTASDAGVTISAEAVRALGLA